MTLFRLLCLSALVSLLSACNAPTEPKQAAEALVETEASSASEPASEPTSERNTEQPRLQVATIDGGTFDLSKEHGHWVVVNFWATWCGPCIKEIPDLSAFDAARDDVVVIGLAYEEISIEDITAFLEKHPAGYAIAILDVYDPPADFDTPRGLPMTYLIAPDGKVARKFLGPVTSNDLAAAIAEAAAPPA